MLGVVAKKGQENIYKALWLKEDKSKSCWFSFCMEKDDNLQAEIRNNLRGFSGTMIVKTKSTIDFQPNDVVKFRGNRYTIINVDGHRKDEGEQAMARFEKTGNVETYLTLRKAGR